MTKEEICEAFLQYLQEKDLDGISYGDFWSVLHKRGLRIRGHNFKNERDNVYHALSSDLRIEKVKPGYFVPRSAKS